MKKRWIKDYCPYAKDQNFLSVVGDVIPGETVFGFSITGTGSAQAVVFKTSTSSKVSQMKDVKYRVIATRITGTYSAPSAPLIYTKLKTGFTFSGAAQSYDIVVVGKVEY